jgi:uncharacterized BrkB/YihY/UPF0761 family membrane protein
MAEAFNPVKTFFKSLAIGLVCAAIGFFTANFIAIVGLAIYQAFSHRTPDYSVAYRIIAAPVGILALLVGFTVIFVRDVKRVGE